MTNIFIIHGTYGTPKENWFPWIKSELEKNNCRVFIPPFPTPKHQSLENWNEIFNDYQKYLSEDTIVVGHSLGTAFLLDVIEKLDKPIKAAFFVSGFLNPLGNPYFDESNAPFLKTKFDWEKIKQNCPKFFVFHSDNDPYVPLTQAENLAKYLGIKVILVKNAGHFNEKAGYSQFNLLLDKIRPFL